MPRRKSGHSAIGLHWPMAGLNRSRDYDEAPPFTTPDCLNVRPTGPFKHRKRGGSRPGLVRTHNQIGSGNSVNMLADCAVIKDDGFQQFYDTFKDALSSKWTAASWASGGLPSIQDDDTLISEFSEQVGADMATITSFDDDGGYEIALFISPYQNAHHGKYYLYARMNDTTPDGDPDSVTGTFVRAVLTLTGSVGAINISVEKYTGGVKDSSDDQTPSASGSADAGWFKLVVDSSNNATAYWNGSQIAQLAVGAPTASYTRVGFGMECTVSGGRCLVDSFRMQYYDGNVTRSSKRVLCAASNGQIYRETYAGTMAVSASSLRVDATKNLMAAERGQKLYIADYGTAIITSSGAAKYASFTDGTLASGHLDTSGVAVNWVSQGLNVNDYVVEITNGTGDTTDGIYEITTFNVATIQLATDPGDGTCTFRILRCPKVYDPSADTLTKWLATTGTMPVNSEIVCTYRDRLVLAREHIWYLSRQGDPLDWLDTATLSDSQRPVSGATSDAGRLAQPITAMAPFSDDYMIIGTESQLWVMKGDPAAGGRIDNLSYMIGIVGKNAWTYGPDGEFIFLSRDGLYVLAPGAQGTPQSVSRERLPQEMIAVDPSQFEVQLSYSLEFRGVHIFLTPTSGRSRLHYFFDWELKGFWPDQYPEDCEPVSCCVHVARFAEDTAVLLGGRDGYIRRFHSQSGRDDGAAISNYCVYGPIRLGAHGYDRAIMDRLQTVLASDSSEVSWSVHVADGAELSVSADSRESGTFSDAGLNYTAYPRAAGAWGCLKLTGSAGKPWAVESIVATIKPAGELRRM